MIEKRYDVMPSLPEIQTELLDELLRTSETHRG